MKLEHVGIAVSNADQAVAALRRVLGILPYKVEDVDSESVRTTFVDVGGPRLEFLESTAEGSAIARHLDCRGEGIHHLAFEIDDIYGAHARLKDLNVRLLNEAPKRGADDKLIFFIHPRETAGVLVELCQTAPAGLEASGTIDGIAFYERGRQDAQPVILLHSALGATELETQHLFPSLEPHFRVIGIDFSGHGQSLDVTDREPSIDHYAEEVITVMDSLGLESASLFGFSMGAVVALRLAHRQPRRIDRVVSHAANVRWDQQEATQMIAALDPDVVKRTTPGWHRRLQQTHGEDRWERLAVRMAHFIQALPAKPLLDDDLADIVAPTLVSHGDSDRYFRLEHALHLRSVIRESKLAVHPGMGHRVGPNEAAVLGPVAARFFRS